MLNQKQKTTLNVVWFKSENKVIIPKSDIITPEIFRIKVTLKETQTC